MVGMNVAMAPRAVYLVAGAVAAVVLTTMVAFWDCPHSSAFACVSVERQAAAVTVLTLTLAPVVYFAKHIYSDKMKGRRASISLYAELSDALNGLDPSKHHDLRVVDVGGKAVHFTSRVFNHDIYDSLVNSGKITFVDIELQQYVQDVFQDLKDHNMALLKVREMEESGASFSLAQELYRTLGDSEQDLLVKIPDILSKIEERYTIPAGAKAKSGQINRDKPRRTA